MDAQQHPETPERGHRQPEQFEPSRLDPKALAAGALTPYCGCLASKKYLLRAKLALSDEDYLDASCHTWCQKTRSAMGPDRDLVGPAECRSDRTCWEPIR